MGPSCAVPSGGVEVVWVARVDHEVHRTHDRFGVPINGQDARPSVAAIFGSVDAASLVLGVQLAQSRDPHAVRAAGVDAHAPDVVGPCESGVGPRASPVVAEVDAISGVRAARGIHLARADQNPSGRVRVHRAKHGGRFQQRLEGGAVVDRLPKPACGVGHVGGVAHHSEVHHPAAHDRWADVVEVQSARPGQRHHGVAVGLNGFPFLGGRGPPGLGLGVKACRQQKQGACDAKGGVDGHHG